MNKTGKYLYCPKCKKYPMEIDGIYSFFTEFRIWNRNEHCYKITDSEIGDPMETVCNECKTRVIEK